MISILIFFGFQVSYFFLGVFKNPAFFFAGYLTVYFMYDRTRWWYFEVPQFSYSFVFSAMVLLFAFIIKKSKPSVFKQAPIVCMILLGLYYLLTYFWAVSPVLHASDTENFIKLLVVMISATFLIKSKKDTEFVMAAYVLGSAYIGYYVAQFGRTSFGRVSGVEVVDAPDVNGVASNLVIGSLFCLYFFWTKKGFIRILVIVCGAFILNSLVLMNSRGAFLGVFVGALWFIYQMYKSKINISRRNLKITGLALAGALSILIVLDQSAIERILSIKSDSQLTTERQSGSTRVFFWKASVEMAIDYPLGGGARSFILLSPNYIPVDVDTGFSRNRAVHSTWFQALTEVGFIGFSLFAIMLLYVYFYLRRLKILTTEKMKKDSFMLVVCLEAALVGYLVTVSFLDRFRAVALYFLVMITVVLYRALMEEDKRRGYTTGQRIGNIRNQ